MKEYLENINKAFESRARLGIMSVLMVEDKVDFNTLKETLQLTDGNLASHLRALEEAEYLRVEKQFVGRKPNTTYHATEAGREAFKSHLDALEQLILNNRQFD
ncbi:winged helix-turn-helix domain-containing protein [Pontibacter chinhatensis]|uniref:Winged helix DNA-binding domain-containing protein n=1 Tax=Pontibacter chinhatensis TaxID=1436961 RepID=A0A1I2WLN2_9BACT|nr:transcriptional regulator [Pontibacter chinhatensis]SFH02238.1 Winged helix DNA-binding domain-containing protein [Pontibacter chinhatensis]